MDVVKARHVGTEITIMLDQKVEAAMRQYTQQYREATAGMPNVYHTIIRTDYMDKTEDAFYKIQGKIALVRTMKAQTPAKPAQKDRAK